MSVELLPHYIDKLNSFIEDELDLSSVIKEVEDNLQCEHIAILVESFPISARKIIWLALSGEFQQNSFLVMKNESRQLLLKALDDKDCLPLFEKLDATQLLELAQDLDDRFIDYAVDSMTVKQRSLFKKAQDYSVEEVGYWQNYQDISLPSTLKLSSAKKVCSKSLPGLSEVAYVVDETSTFLGEVSINKLLSVTLDTPLLQLINNEVITVSTSDNISDAAEKVILSGKSALAVIDEQGRLTGRIDLHTAYKYKDQITEHQIMHAGGLTEEEDLFANVWLSSKNRAIWLGINLITAFAASWFIGLFEATIQQVVALAVLMPVVASMGGISGSQTITLIIRGLALGQITAANRQNIVNKELKVGVINGVLWASIIGIITYIWFDNFLLSLTIFIAILGNILIASLSGVWVPWLLTKFNIDPALSGAVILTTVTDIFGFIAFLGIGSLLLI